jgi:type VI secretion system protein ImpL
VSNSLFSVGQDRVIYDMGAQKESRLTWPGASGGARLSVTTNGPEPDALVFEGPWALFRLMERAQIDARSESAYRVRWTLERKGAYAVDVPYEIFSATAVNPFARDFFAFDCPRQLGPMMGAAAAPSATGDF